MNQLAEDSPNQPAIQTSLVDVTDTLSTRQEMPCRVLFKMESEQPSGSFKLRGIGHLVHESIKEARALRTEKPIQVFALSGGNAGLAAAYSARHYKVACTVVVPSATMASVITRLEKLGARVILHGASIQHADMFARELMATELDRYHGVYCHPFDNPLIWQGHATMMDEIFHHQLASEDREKVKAVVCLVGGGGLYNGIKTGLERNNSTADCLLVETKQAPTLTEAVKARSVVMLDSVKSMATSLACSFVSEDTLEKFFKNDTNKSHLLAIDDKEALRGSIAYHRDFGHSVEPACGAALSVVYNHLDFLTSNVSLSPDDIVVVVVCGGVCADEAAIASYKSLVRALRL